MYVVFNIKIFHAAVFSQSTQMEENSLLLFYFHSICLELAVSLLNLFRELYLKKEKQQQTT